LRTSRRLLRLVLTMLVTVGPAGARPQDSAGVAAPPEAGASMRDVVASGSLADLRWPDFSDYKAHLENFYGPSGYAPAWVRDGQPSPQALAMIEAFRNARNKGLEPEDYDASRWSGRLEGLKTPGADPAPFDVAMSVCAMRLVSDLHIGRTNPQHFHFGLSVDQKKYDLPRFLRERLLPAPDVAVVLEETEPPFPTYKRTKAALDRYLELASRDEGGSLPVPEKPVDPGQTYAGAPRLRGFLALVGDLPPDGVTPADPETYDGALADGVRRFQRRHGLEEDGRLGPGTVRQLNVPLSERVRQLQLTLERWRWLPDEFAAPPIIVNIPDFGLRALEENNRIAKTMRVVVGKAMRTETPVFSRDMTYVVLRPYWNVPPSILRGEIVPAVERDRNYIAAKRYEVTTHDGRVVTDGEVSDDVLSALKAGKLAVRQKPGPANALGLVKLMFPNEHNVYLHSTPAPALFAKSRRDFSHGCIRVERPADLAAWALRDNPDWTLERVEAAMESGPDNVTVKLVRPIPVFILYGTAVAYENGEVHFSDDIYGHDATLAAALAKGYPYPR
jgi:murein L,D-transpeptidase YcbB/YkuD